MPDVNKTAHDFVVEHIKIRTSKSFSQTASALEREVPHVDSTVFSRLAHGETEAVKEELESGPDLAIFEKRDHGGTDKLIDHARNCFQYEIGNPLTASKMTSHVLAAGLYAPLRVILYDNEDGGCTFEYDRPSQLFGQFKVDAVTAVARDLDVQISSALTKAAS